jgi:hypothetical protein
MIWVEDKILLSSRWVIRCRYIMELSTTYMSHNLASVKETVARDFRLLVFSPLEPPWALDSCPKIFSKSVSNSPRYANSKFECSKSRCAAISYSGQSLILSCSQSFLVFNMRIRNILLYVSRVR